MKFFPFLIAAAAVLVAAPLSAAPKASAAGADMGEEDAAAPKTGVRFVICAPDGATLPSPLFYKSGKASYKSVSISARTPSPRIRPENGVINFYGSDPSAIEAAAKAEKKEAKLPEPVLSIPVNGTGKQLCIVVPSKDPKAKPQTFFTKESAFPKGGMHIINFSSYPLRMTLFSKPDGSDKKEQSIGVFHRDKGICEENTWSFNGENGTTVSFILAFKSKEAKDFKNFKSSKFVVTDRQSQINIVVKDPTRETLKLLSIQLTDDK